MQTVKVVIASIVLLMLALGTASAADQDMGWPRQQTANGNVLVMYQPQIDSWQNFSKLNWRMAVSLTPAGGKPAIGVVVLKGDTNVDTDSHMVLITNLNVVNINFPSLNPGDAAQMSAMVTTFLPQAVVISLDRVMASMPKKTSLHGVKLKNKPPVIFVDYKPAILLEVDGKPVRVPIQHTDLEYIVNTHWPLFFEKTKSRYVLLAGEQWLQASKLDGPWSAATQLPNDMGKVVKEAHWKDLKPYVPLHAKSGTAVPAVYYSTRPAEIILFDGQPKYTNIPGTRLAYANNTTSYFFYLAAAKQYFYLTAGRWFSASSLAGPWTFATSSLPADFSQIPPSSPAGQVLASVPGTDEAKNAVLMAEIPTTVTVNAAAAAAQAKVFYDGAPQFAPIEGTSLMYATNTAQKVIKVGDHYYMCLQGVWFVSTHPQGPWQTAQSVPEQIYTIPPSSPVYNVTYATQHVVSDAYVEASYTSGYTGAYVMDAGDGVVIVGGTGYYYPPYLGYPVYGYPIYRPYPLTYGAIPYYNPVTGAYGVSQRAYGPYGSATRTATYNPYTGTYARTASVSTVNGSTTVGRAYNPYTGAYGVTRQGSNAYSQWGSSVVTKGGQSAFTQHYSTAQGSFGSVQTTSGGKAAGVNTVYGTSAVGKTASDNLYAGHDGNVYKNSGSGWQKYDNGSWNPIEKPTPNRAAAGSGQSLANDQVHNLQSELQSRQRGEQSTARFQSYQRSIGGGGFSRGRR